MSKKNLGGNAEICSGTPKKGCSNISAEISPPPVSEVLDPLEPVIHMVISVLW